MALVLQGSHRMNRSINGHGPIRVAFVGSGKMARLHLHALRRVTTPHVVVGVCDSIASAADEFAALSGSVAFSSVPELLAVARPHLVHVCTPAGMHFDPARLALESGAHVYVEKPFVETEREAQQLLDIAAKRGLLVCAGHQQVRDPAYVKLLERVGELGAIAQVDCHFTFRPPGMNAERAGPRTLAGQLLDILPHPLYTLVATLERATADPSSIEIASLATGTTDLHAVIRGGDSYGRLSVSLRARPVASTLSVSGSGGMLTTDFIRTSVVGAGNPGTAPLEKIANPLVESGQSAVRSMLGIARRIVGGGDYPGLAELIGEFYAAVATGAASPLAPDHIHRVTALYEEMAANVRGAAERAAVLRPAVRAPVPTAPLAVVTGARGFFGKAIAAALVRRGYRVRGIGRSADAEDPNVHEWVRADLSRGVPSAALSGAAVIVHAAAESTGGFDEHRRNSIDATRAVLRAMPAAGVTRLVYISSLSVLSPPRTPWERQDEHTALVPPGARQFGAYTWGKTEAERIVDAEAAPLGIETRTIRPAALVDWSNPDMPGLVGRQLFGRWHLGFGRPGLPFAACDVETAASVVASAVEQFYTTAPIVNLIDPDIRSRGQLLDKFRSHGWRGRMLWMPISVFAVIFSTVRIGIGVLKFKRPAPMAVWSLFRPRRFDTALAQRAIEAATTGARENVQLLAAQMNR